MLKRIIDNGWQWPILIITILGSSVIANIAVVIRASSDPSFVIEKDYYDNALNWDASQEAKRKSEALGWELRAHAAIVKNGDAKLQVQVEVEDAQGRPIEDANVWVKGFAIARSADVVSGAMPRGAEGYRAELDAHRPGLWQLDFKVSRGSDVFIHSMRTDVYVR